MRRTAVVLGVAMLAGCAASGAVIPRWVDGATWRAGELHAVQRIELRRGGAEPRTLQAQVEGSPAGVQVALLDALGRRLLLLRSGREGYAEQRDPRLPRAVDGRSILADIVLAHWPSAELRAMLPPALDLREDGEGARALSRDGTTLAKVTCTGAPWNGRCVVSHAGDAEVLTIDSRRLSP